MTSVWPREVVVETQRIEVEGPSRFVFLPDGERLHSRIEGPRA